MISLWDINETERLVLLPSELVEQEPPAFTGVFSVVERALARNIILFEGPDYNPIRVFAGTQTTATILFKDLADLHALTQVPDAQYVWNHHGAKIKFRFPHEDPPVISAVPIHMNKPVFEENDRFHSLTIKIMEL